MRQSNSVSVSGIGGADAAGGRAMATRAAMALIVVLQVMVRTSKQLFAHSATLIFSAKLLTLAVCLRRSAGERIGRLDG